MASSQFHCALRPEETIRLIRDGMREGRGEERWGRE